MEYISLSQDKKQLIIKGNKDENRKTKVPEHRPQIINHRSEYNETMQDVSC